MKTLLEEAAGETVRVIVAGARVERRDVPGAPPGTHDLDVVLGDDSRIPVEVTMATDPPARELWEAVCKHPWTMRELEYSWSLHIRPDTRVDALHERVGGLLAELERAGLDRFNAREPHDGPAKSAMDELARLGVRLARATAPHGEPLVLVGAEGSGAWVDGSDICKAVEWEAAKPDNRSKLRAAGGGDLFVWIDHHAADAHAAMCGELFVPREPAQLPEEFSRVWAARYVIRPNGVLRAAAQLRGDPDTGWADLTAELNR